jgi:signal transduction histidine kinase
LNNVLKHSEAKNVKVEMNVRGLEFELKVTDNGRGFDTSKALAASSETRGRRGGNGLRNMRQRLLAIGGECLVASQPGAGSVVTVQVRLNEGKSKQP